MRKKITPLLFALSLVTFCNNFSYAQDAPTQNAPTILNEKPAVQVEPTPIPVTAVSNVSAPTLVAPVVEEPKRLLKPQDRKVDLRAIIFDPAVVVEEPENAEEMTKAEVAKYKIGEALKGEVSAVSTKGMLADSMKMSFEKGPIDSIVPWFDYNGYFASDWNGPTYKNETYGINFADVGFNINMKNPDNYFRFMFSPVKTYAGKNYFQTFFADNYFTHKVGKNNKFLIGNTWLPMGFEGKESPLVWQFFNRSQLTMNYAGVRTLGAKWMGNYKYADYHLGVYSSERGFFDWFPGPEVAGWVELKPMANLDEKKYGKLTIGAGFNGGNAQSHYAVGMGGINYEYKRLRATTEFGIADGSNGALGYNKYKSSGINGTLAYRVTPRLQALVRYDQFDPNTEKANNMRREYTIGANYFIKGQALKLMFNYVLYSMETGTYGSRILVGTQIIL